MSTDQAPSPSTVVAAYMDRLNAADVPGIAALFAPDGTVMGPGMPTVTGRDALVRFFDQMLCEGGN